MHDAEVDTLPARMLATAAAAGSAPFHGGTSGDLVWLPGAACRPGRRGDHLQRSPRRPRSGGCPSRTCCWPTATDLDLPGRRVRVVWTPGHTPGHICLHDADHDLLLTGDHLLPRITPNIGLAPVGPGSPLPGYLGSLRRLRDYDSAEALPAHEYRFRGIAGRADADRRPSRRARRRDPGPSSSHHGPTAWQIAQRLTWSRGWAEITGFMRRAALAETAAHVAYLRDEGRDPRSRAGGWPGPSLACRDFKYFGICRAGPVPRPRSGPAGDPLQPLVQQTHPGLALRFHQHAAQDPRPVGVRADRRGGAGRTPPP